MNRTNAQALAAAVIARMNCEQSNNVEWFDRWTKHIENIVDNGPSGSGIDCGTKILLDECSAGKIVLATSFHHMDDGGCYDGWTEHKIIVRPDWNGVDVTITGKDRNGIKEYLGDAFQSWLGETCELQA